MTGGSSSSSHEPEDSEKADPAEQEPEAAVNAVGHRHAHRNRDTGEHDQDHERDHKQLLHDGIDCTRPVP